MGAELGLVGLVSQSVDMGEGVVVGLGRRKGDANVDRE